MYIDDETIIETTAPLSSSDVSISTRSIENKPPETPNFLFAPTIIY